MQDEPALPKLAGYPCSEVYPACRLSDGESAWRREAALPAQEGECPGLGAAPPGPGAGRPAMVPTRRADYCFFSHHERMLSVRLSETKPMHVHHG
jgi:hypothetical protein